jgi:hypothetical protein
MRDTHNRDLAQVTNWVKPKFAAMNLKKPAKWKWRTFLSLFRFLIFKFKYIENPVRAAA